MKRGKQHQKDEQGPGRTERDCRRKVGATGSPVNCLTRFRHGRDGIRLRRPGTGDSDQITGMSGRIVPARMSDTTPAPGDTALRRSQREAIRDLPPPSGHPRFPLLDPLRAVAAISVLLIHVAIVSGGFEPWYKRVLGHLDIGVPFFFLLSGFLLYRPMLASRVSALPAQRLRDYGRNRFFRIFPLYWFILTFTAIVPGMYGAFTENWWVYYGLLQNYPIYTAEGECAVTYFRCGIPPSWTLAVEVFFYFLLPFFALGMAWLGRKFGVLRESGSRRFFTRWVTLEVAVLGLLIAISFWIQSSPPDGGLHEWLFFSPIGRAWWFGLGMALAVVSVRAAQTGTLPALARQARDHSGWFWLAAGGLYLIGTYWLFESGPALAVPFGNSSQYLSQYFFFGVVSLLILAPAVFSDFRRGIANRVLAHPILIRLGLISYGIFLWHYPVMAWLSDRGVLDWIPGARFTTLAITTFLLTVLLSELTHRLIERPLMRWSRSRSKRV